MACRALQDWTEVRTFLSAILLTACAELPPCPKAPAAVLQSEDGTYYLGFTPAMIQTWVETIQKEAKGECAFRKKGNGT